MLAAREQLLQRRRNTSDAVSTQIIAASTSLEDIIANPPPQMSAQIHQKLHQIMDQQNTTVDVQQQFVEEVERDISELQDENFRLHARVDKVERTVQQQIKIFAASVSTAVGGVGISCHLLGAPGFLVALGFGSLAWPAAIGFFVIGGGYLLYNHFRGKKSAGKRPCDDAGASDVAGWLDTIPNAHIEDEAREAYKRTIIERNVTGADMSGYTRSDLGCIIKGFEFSGVHKTKIFNAWTSMKTGDGALPIIHQATAGAGEHHRAL